MPGDTERMMEDAVEQGRANQVIVELARRHCLHMTFTQWGGRGMAEEMTGLPINMRQVSCPQALGGGAAMNLEWIATDFYNANCVGCQHRRPTGEVPNLASFVEEKKAAMAAARTNARAELESRRESWLRRVDQRRGLAAGADLAMANAIADIAVLDAEPGCEVDATERTAAVARLSAMAERAPATFTTPVVDLALQLVERENATGLLAPLRRLTRGRPEFGAVVLAAAVAALRRIADPDAGACVAELADHLRPDALDPDSIRSLVILAGAPEDHFGPPRPRRANDPTGLRAATKVSPRLVVDVLRDLMPLRGRPPSSLVLPDHVGVGPDPAQVDDFIRASACNATRWLAATHPDVAAELVDNLVRGLTVDAVDYNEDEPTHAAQHALAAMLILGVGSVLEATEIAAKNGSNEYRQRLFAVVERAVRLVDPHDRWREPGDPQLDDEPRLRFFDRLLETCLARVGGDWGPETAYQAADVVSDLATTEPSWALGHLDSILGAFLSTLDELRVAPMPQLAIVDTTPPALASLELFSRRMTANSTARELLDAVEAAAAVDPLRVCRDLAAMIVDERDTERGSDVRWRVVPRLGNIGKRHGHEPRLLQQILPILHSYLVDDDPVLRAGALNAWVEIASAHDLPSIVVDLLPALLADTYVVVIEALLDAARRLRWADDARAQLLIYAIRVCEVASFDQKDMLTKAMAAVSALTRDNRRLQLFGQEIILRRAADFDGYELRDALRGEWLPEIQHNPDMAALRLRLARDPRFNSRDDAELCDLLDCGSGAVALPLEDLTEAAVELGPDRPLASAEFAEVAWRAGRADDAESIMRAFLGKIPEQPAYESRRVLARLIADCAALDAAAAAGEHTELAVDALEQAVASLASESADRRVDLVQQVSARIAVRQLLADRLPPHLVVDDSGIAPAEAPASYRRRRADLLAAAGTELERRSQRLTATGAYMRAVARLCDVGACLLRLDAAELDADVVAVDANATAAHRRGELLAAELHKWLTPEDPIASAVYDAAIAAQSINSGSAVAETLATWSGLVMPLLVIEGPRARPFPRNDALDALDHPDADTSEIAVAFASIDGKLVTGPLVLRPNYVYDLELEVHPGVWPEWAEHLDAEFIGVLTENEITLPAFSWPRADGSGGEDKLAGTGTVVLRYGLPAGQPAPPFLVSLRWRGRRDGSATSESIDVAGHRELRFRPFDASRDFLTDYPVFDERLLALYERLHGAGYDELQIQAFCRLLTSVCRIGLRMTWDKKYKRGSKVLEAQFHDDLYERLLSDPELEGRLERGSPLALGFLDVRHDGITAELKVERRSPVTRETAPKYMGQPTQYAAADGARLSILCVLDMSPKLAPIGTPENYLFTLQPALHGLENPEAPSLVAAIVVNGNLPAPSSWSRRKARIETSTANK